ncbi:MAG: methyltransferase domain-containing protein [Pseudomonadota bacterium]
MRTSVSNLQTFYTGMLGQTAAEIVCAQVQAAWQEHKGARIVGFGYAAPFLEGFSDAERCLWLAPEEQGATRWPSEGKNRVGIVKDNHWPLPDASVDRLLIIHGLEESGRPLKLMREAWRVLADDGKMIVVTGHRRGAWSVVDTTPFAAGRPYLKGQLVKLLNDCMFEPVTSASALYFPPIGARFVLRAANAWEAAGERLWPWLAGVVMIEARKRIFQGIAQDVQQPKLVNLAAHAKRRTSGAAAMGGDDKLRRMRRKSGSAGIVGHGFIGANDP